MTSPTNPIDGRDRRPTAPPALRAPQSVAETGVRRALLLTDDPAEAAGLQAGGVEVVGHLPLQPPGGPASPAAEVG